MVLGRNWESLEMFKEHCLKLKRGMPSKIIVKSFACFHVEDYSCQEEAVGAVFVWFSSEHLLSGVKCYMFIVCPILVLKLPERNNIICLGCCDIPELNKCLLSN